MKQMRTAIEIVKSEIPMDTPGMEKRLMRAVNDILLGQGTRYELTRVSPTEYTCLRYSTSIFEDNSVTYLLNYVDGTWLCMCPDYENAPFNLCKHRLAVQVNEEVLRDEM